MSREKSVIEQDYAPDKMRRRHTDARGDLGFFCRVILGAATIGFVSFAFWSTVYFWWTGKLIQWH